jgi:hypothetical protein
MITGHSLTRAKYRPSRMLNGYAGGQPFTGAGGRLQPLPGLINVEDYRIGVP